MTCLAEMPQHRKKQQHQGNHQLSPSLPPTGQRLPSRSTDGVIHGALLGWKTPVRKGFQDTVHITLTGSEVEPG